MEYSSIDREAVFLNEDCRRIFGQSQYTDLTKKRAIRSTIQQSAISVQNFTEDKLVAILYYLIKQGVFLAAASIQLQFPDLYHLVPTDETPDAQSFNVRPSYTWLESLLNNSRYSDLILTFGDKKYPAHRSVVCSQSSVIDKKCQFQHVRQSLSCNTCGTTPKYFFDFMDDDPQSVHCLIQYMYRQDYCILYSSNEGDQEYEKNIENPEEIKPSDDCVDDHHPILHVRVYALAEKYDIPPLKELALNKFNNKMQQGLSLDRLLDSAEEAYTSTISEDRGMRDSIVKHFHAHPELLDDEHVRETIKRVDSLTIDLLMYWHGKYTRQSDTVL